jgi:glycerol-3-phosphate dehydrogenase
VGTTDTHVDHIDAEPMPLTEEIHFVLEHFNRYTNEPITKEDVLSVFVGLRPLVKSASSNISSLLSRDHTLVVSPSRLVTITGGKWTTYRKMAEDAVNNAVFVAKLDGAGSGEASGTASGAKKCITKDLPIGDLGAARDLATQLIAADSSMAAFLTPAYPAFAIRVVDVVVAARCKYVRTVEDFLARRNRLLFLDARAAIILAPSVATILQKELNWTNEEREAQLQSFIQLAQQYIIH